MIISRYKHVIYECKEDIVYVMLETSSENVMTQVLDGDFHDDTADMLDEINTINKELGVLDNVLDEINRINKESEALNAGMGGKKIALSDYHFYQLVSVMAAVKKIQREITEISRFPEQGIRERDNIISGCEALINRLNMTIKEDNISMESPLVAAGRNVMDTLSTETQSYSLERHSNKSVTITKKTNIRAIEYQFDKVDLPTWLLTPEIMTVIANRVLIRQVEDGQYVTGIRPEYVANRYLAPIDDPHMDFKMCIPLSDELLRCCLKFLDKTCKYAPLGCSSYETMEQQIENYMVTGRADRIVSTGPTGPGPEATAMIILRESRKSIVTRNVLVGSFPLDGVHKRVEARERWLRVVVD